jgi:hypothetical protein
MSADGALRGVKSRSVAGITCISPTAPAELVARASKLDSV